MFIGKAVKKNKGVAFTQIGIDWYRPHEGLTLETHNFLPFTVANLRLRKKDLFECI